MPSLYEVPPVHWQSGMRRRDVSDAIQTMSARMLGAYGVHPSEHREFQAALISFLHLAMTVTGSERGNIQLVDPTDGSLRLVAQHGFAKPFLEFFRIVKGDKSACAAALAAASPIVIEDVRKSRHYTESTREAMLAGNALACQSTPIVVDRAVIGMISTHASSPRCPTPAELRRLALIATEAAPVILAHQYLPLTLR